MQHKRRRPRRGVYALVLLGAVAIGIGVLATRHIPAPQKLVEKQLDAKAFLDTRQP